MLRHNIGTVDRLTRHGLGLALVIIGVFGMEAYSLGALIVTLLGVSFVIVATFAICPVCYLFGVNTCEKCRTGEHPGPTASKP